MTYLNSALPHLDSNMERISGTFRVCCGMGVRKPTRVAASQARGWSGSKASEESLIWNGIGTETALQYIGPNFYKLMIHSGLTEESYIDNKAH